MLCDEKLRIMKNEAELKAEIKQLKKSLWRSILDVIGQIVGLLLLGFVCYDYFAKDIQPTNFRVMLILLLAIQSYGSRK